MPFQVSVLILRWDATYGRILEESATRQSELFDETLPIEGVRPVGPSVVTFRGVLSRVGLFENTALRGGKLHLKLNITARPIVNKYREGKLKRTLKRGFKRA